MTTSMTTGQTLEEWASIREFSSDVTPATIRACAILDGVTMILVILHQVEACVLEIPVVDYAHEDMFVSVLMI